MSAFGAKRTSTGQIWGVANADGTAGENYLAAASRTQSSSTKIFIGLTAVEAAPPSRTVTLALGENTREVALVDKPTELGNVREPPARLP